MFFVLSKILDVALDPLAWTIALVAAGALLARRRPPAAAAALAVAVVVGWGLGCPAGANAIARYAERGVRDGSRPGVVYDAVVVLGGGMEQAFLRAGRVELSEAADRIVEVGAVLRDGRARFGLISSGDLYGNEQPSEAEATARLLAGWGIDPARLVLETRSRNTRQNAVESARIARERGWTRLLLVTSANHMPRALGCFRAVGLDPDPLPTDFRARPEAVRPILLLPRARALGESAEMLRELGGRVVYRLVGYSR